MNIVYTIYRMTRPNISHEFTEKITKMFTKLLQKMAKQLPKKCLKLSFEVYHAFIESNKYIF